MSIRAHMPECYTSIVLRSSIPENVRLDNATVLHVGEELWNRTLEVDDSKPLVSVSFLFSSPLIPFSLFISFVFPSLLLISFFLPSLLSGLFGSDYITHTDLLVEFLFGLNVTVPGNNTILDDEQDFEIALQSTVQNDPSLIHNSKLRYSAFVETDFGTKTGTRVVTLTVSPLPL